MESSGAKLNIVFSIGFLAAFCEATEQARRSGNDEALLQYLNLRSLLFRFSDQRRILANNGEEVSEEMFRRAYADLLMHPELRSFGLSKKDEEIHAPDNDDLTMLLNAPSQQLVDFSIMKGVIASNCEILHEEFSKATLKWNYNFPIQFSGYESSSKEIEIENLFPDYRLPSNRFVLLDPYLYTWGEEYCAKAVAGLIKSIVSGGTIEGQKPLDITIITTFPDSYHPPQHQSYPSEIERKEKVGKIHTLLYTELKKNRVCSLELHCIDLYQIKLQLKDAKDHPENYDPKTIKFLKEFQKFCKERIHDRWFFTNYFYCDSGRGFNLTQNNGRLSKYWHKMTLFSQFQDEHFKVRKTYEELVAQIKIYSEQEELRGYFYSAH